MTTPRPAEDLPTRFDAAGRCPNPACDKYVHFQRQFPGRGYQVKLWPQFIQVEGGEGDGSSKRAAGTLWLDVWLCPACNQTTVVFDHRPVVEGEFPASEPGRIRRQVLAWPRRAPREVDEAVPEEIRSLFTEGSEAERSGALRAAAAMYRATVEELCAERGAAGRNLYDKIEDLKTKGVSDDIVEHLHEGRMLGNWSLHDGLVFSTDEVADVADLIYEALFEIYVQPAQRAAMRDARRNRRAAHRANGAESS